MGLSSLSGSPFSGVLLFCQDSPEFRCTDSEATVQPSPYLSYRLPKDFVDLSTGEDAYKLIDFLKLVTDCHSTTPPCS